MKEKNVTTKTVENNNNTTLMNMALTLFINNDSYWWGQFHVKMIMRIIKMIDRLTACMQEGYNSNANQISHCYTKLITSSSCNSCFELFSPLRNPSISPFPSALLGMMMIIIAMTLDVKEIYRNHWINEQVNELVCMEEGRSKSWAFGDILSAGETRTS
jgi:hypothetical protein